MRNVPFCVTILAFAFSFFFLDELVYYQIYSKVITAI